MSSAEAPSAAVRTITPPFLTSRRLRMSRRRDALVVLQPARDAEALAARDEDDEAAGERDLGRQPGALRLHRVLDRLDEHLLAAAQQVLDLAAVRAAFQLRRDDLVDVEEAVLLEADLDERGLHPGQHVVDGALVDVAGDRAALGPLEVGLGDLVVLEDGDALLADVDGDQQLALGGRQRRAALRGPAPGRALLAGGGTPLGALASFFCGRLGFGLVLPRPLRLRPWPASLRPRPPRLPRRGACVLVSRSVAPASAGFGLTVSAGVVRRARSGAARSSMVGLRRRNHRKQVKSPWLVRARCHRSSQGGARAAACGSKLMASPTG